jgi:hypothetical protein
MILLSIYIHIAVAVALLWNWKHTQQHFAKRPNVGTFD